MKNLIFILSFVLSYTFTFAQVIQVDLAQTTGEFATTSLTLEAGSYQFNITNKDVNHEVGFVLVPKGKYDTENHIKEAYVKAAVPTGSSSMTSVVNLATGEYEYFCPLNPTPKYSLDVHDKVETIKMNQTPGEFKNKYVSVREGAYKFEIFNDGVDHEVGFVLVPKGKYDAEHHIQAAYVKSPVADGNSSLSNIVELTAGEYEYFCPLNPTPKYSLTVSK